MSSTVKTAGHIIIPFLTFCDVNSVKTVSEYINNKIVVANFKVSFVSKRIRSRALYQRDSFSGENHFLFSLSGSSLHSPFRVVYCLRSCRVELYVICHLALLVFEIVLFFRSKFKYFRQRVICRKVFMSEHLLFGSFLLPIFPRLR